MTELWLHPQLYDQPTLPCFLLFIPSPVALSKVLHLFTFLYLCGLQGEGAPSPPLHRIHTGFFQAFKYELIKIFNKTVSKK